MSPAEIAIRRMDRRDLPEVGRIQAASPEASQWEPEEYLGYDSIVAEREGRLEGFAVARLLPPDEFEILNVATDPGVRRQGVGRALLQALLKLPGKVLFLEVRESNSSALSLYKAAGFAEAGRRRNYYPTLGFSTGSREDAVVMKLQK
jgi:ribosomal-protein-alanine N-acetyltransferase